MAPDERAAAIDETVDEFRVRARAWLAENMPLMRGPVPSYRDPRSEDHWVRQRELQRMLWDGGFAGICFPREYGGLGLPIEYKEAFTDESLPYELPFFLGTPTFSILAATLAERGTHEQKSQYLPGIIRGDHVWIQLLSEPSGGSDVAGATSRADRDGDVWVINGSKIWSSSADAADYGMALVRTNWDVPKHAGLSMFIVDLHQPGVTVEPIRQVNNNRGFCQVFFDDVTVPASAVVGDVDDGWTITSALLNYERDAVGGLSPYVTGRNLNATGSTSTTDPAAAIARRLGVADDPLVHQLVGEHRMIDLVQRAFVERVSVGTSNGTLPAHAGATLRLYSAVAAVRKIEITMTIAGEVGVVWPAGDADQSALAGRYLCRQAESLAGGSSEIQRNIISERLLGMPREPAADRGVPYREVKRSAPR